MPVVFDIVGLVNNVREPVNHDGDDLEDNPFVTDEDNPLLRMDSIGQGSADRFVPAGLTPDRLRSGPSADRFRSVDPFQRSY